MAVKSLFGFRLMTIRKFRGITQQELGEAIGFSKTTAASRIAQYETGFRFPKDDIVEKIADVLNVSKETLDIPDIFYHLTSMSELFFYEDMYGLRPVKVKGDSRIHICFDKKSEGQLLFQNDLELWYELNQKLEDGKISKEEYDQMRYHWGEQCSKADLPGPDFQPKLTEMHLITYSPLSAEENTGNRKRKGSK